MYLRMIIAIIAVVSALLTFFSEEEETYRLGDPPKTGVIALMQTGVGDKAIDAEPETSEGPEKSEGNRKISAVSLEDQGIPVGHLNTRKIIRQVVPSRHLYNSTFYSEQADELREYATLTQISPYDFSKGEPSSRENFFFCDDGTFSYRRSFEEDEAGRPPEFSRGVWDSVAEGRNSALVMYSDAPSFAELSIGKSGLMVIPIAERSEEVLQLGYYGSQGGLETLFVRSEIVECP